MNKYENSVGVLIPEILLPKEGTDMTKWAVVACDQFTSQPDYWQETESIVGDAPSTLRLMLPEMYLEKPDEAERIEKINATMKSYLDTGVLENIGRGIMYVERRAGANVRHGIMVALDLECYEYSKGSTTLIRATEGTIVERIPPRLRIRKDAPVELPHILVLIDDPERTVIEPIGESVGESEKRYDFELMQGGGHIKGYFIKDDARIDRALRALEALASPEVFSAKYGTDAPSLLFAMGDGNHSFATAKANWEQIKKTLSPEEAANHPARYALVELENVHDSGIEFEPIHRVVFGVDTHKAIAWLSEKLSEQNGETEMHLYGSKAERDDAMAANACSKCHLLPFMIKEGYGYFKVSDPAAQLEVGTLQNALDIFIKETDGATIDYIHGEQVVDELGRKDNNIGFILPNMGKSAFLKTGIFDGARPRKTFSMGAANEKRNYVVCRRISK